MDLFLIDDASQKSPSRPAMGAMVGVGGLHVPSASVRHLERDLDGLCQRTGFPAGEEFKWFPSLKAWMHANLRYDARRDFFLGGAPARPEGPARRLAQRPHRQHGQRCVPRMLEHAPRDELDPTFPITHHLPLEDAPRDYEMFKSKEDGCVRAVFAP